jgi:nicotinamide mononucleotide transporter
LSAIEVWAVFFGVAGVALTIRQNVWCWPVGLVNLGLSLVVFYQAKLYSDTALQLVYVALSLYGWYHWLHPGMGRRELPVSRISAREAALLLALGTAFALALGSFLRYRTDAALPFWDAGTTAASLAAQWLQTRKIIENWHIWIVADVVYVGMYVVKGLWPMAGLYLLFVILAVLGLRAWARSLAS